MLRYLKVNTSFNHFQAFHPQLFNLQPKKARCSLCNKVTDHAVVGGSVFHLISTYSTSVTAKLLNNEKKKKKIWKNTKYTDLLEVSEKKTSERKTKIKKLTGNSLHMIQGTHLSSNMFKNNELPDDSLELEEVGSIVYKHDGIKDEADHHEPELYIEPVLVSEKVFDDINHKGTLQPNEIQASETATAGRLMRDYREKLARIKATDLAKIWEEKNFNSSLVSYVELCMNCGFLNRGLYTVNYYLNKNNLPISDLRIFNHLFEGFAKSGKYDKLMEIWKTMLEIPKLKPDITSYARRFEAIARSTKRNKSELLFMCLREMEEQGFTLDNIFQETEWKVDAREVVLSAIKVLRPNFRPKITNINTDYSCYLVQHLNDPPISPLTSPADNLFSIEDLKILFKEQFDLEMKTYVSVKSIDAEKNPEITEYTNFCRKQLEKLESTWDTNIHNSLTREISSMCAIHKHLHKYGGPINIFPYLAVLNKCDYVDIIKHEIRKLAMGSETYSPTVSILCKNLGDLVKLRYDIKKKQSDGILEKEEKIYHEYLKWYLNPNMDRGGFNARHTWQLASSTYHEGPTLGTEGDPWPYSILIAIGKFLYNIILRDVKIDVNILKQNSNSEHLVPAFYTIFRQQSKHSSQEVKPHPVLSRLFRNACLQKLYFSVAELPMVSPPLPWSSIRMGGYLLANAPLIRLPTSAIAQRDRLKEAAPDQLYPCLDSLNQLGSVPWRVNTKILDIVVKLFNLGGNDKLNVPPPPSQLSPLKISNDMTKQEKHELYKARLIEKRRRAEMYSLWCDALYRLSLAQHFRDRVFWLPHNMDFRGRVYPCPPHLNHLGSDLYRSLLVFAQKQPLGPKGLQWLKLHTINLTGFKKRDSIADRLKYAEEILPEMIDSANNPMKNGSWWQLSEKPWQTLAACIELRDALCSPEGPENYLSGFPIHQDGSCNGLQHYAAIGRDAAGAASVNLSPAPIPQDVYSCVAAIVDRERAKDAANGVMIAQILEGFITRKVVKQTVMTTVYGVTKFGARLQIAKQLRDIDNFPQENVWAASLYLSTKTFDSIKEMFTSTREIQDWFTEAAQQIAGIRGESVEYITPLGLPVVQPYSKSSSIATLFTPSGKCSINNKLDKFERPNVMKQKNAFPPNFIHSLDSTHMMLTSLHSQRAGITFVSVHDCFWTHANSVNVMNKICREQFVALHSQPILEDLSRFMINRYAFEDDSSDKNLPAVAVQAKQNLNSLLRNYPKKGDFKLENVLDSVYFFS